MAPLRAPGKGKRLGGRDPPLMSSLTTQGEDGELERPVLQMSGARVSVAPHLPFKCTVGMRPLPALGHGDPRGYYQDLLPAREDLGLSGLLASYPAAPPPALMLHWYLIP